MAPIKTVKFPQPNRQPYFQYHYVYTATRNFHQPLLVNLYNVSRTILQTFILQIPRRHDPSPVKTQLSPICKLYATTTTLTVRQRQDVDPPAQHRTLCISSLYYTHEKQTPPQTQLLRVCVCLYMYHRQVSEETRANSSTSFPRRGAFTIVRARTCSEKIGAHR